MGDDKQGLLTEVQINDEEFEECGWQTTQLAGRDWMIMTPLRSFDDLMI